MTLKAPALDPSTVTPRRTSGYPEPFRSRVLPREKLPLAAALKLVKLGLNLTTLPPGKESSMRHHHSREEEFVFVVEGEVTLVTNEGEQLLKAGTCAGFPAGTGNGHQLVNRSTAPARYLEVSTHEADDAVEYSDVDLAYAQGVYSHKDGRPY